MFSGFVALGSQYDAVTRAGIPNTGFAGWLSQVNIWNRSLAIDEITQLTSGGVNSALNPNGRVAQWHAYILALGVKVIRPSTIGQMCSNPMMTGYPACTTPLPGTIIHVT